MQQPEVSAASSRHSAGAVRGGWPQTLLVKTCAPTASAAASPSIGTPRMIPNIGPGNEMAVRNSVLIQPYTTPTIPLAASSPATTKDLRSRGKANAAIAITTMAMPGQGASPACSAPPCLRRQRTRRAPRQRVQLRQHGFGVRHRSAPDTARRQAAEFDIAQCSPLSSDATEKAQSQPPERRADQPPPAFNVAPCRPITVARTRSPMTVRLSPESSRDQLLVGETSH
jgi:hypothetical protein